MGNKTAPQNKQNKLTPADRARIEAYCALELSDYQKAVAPAQKAVQLCPQHAPSEAILALSLRGIEKYNDALIHAENAHKLDPNNTELKFVYGLCKWYAYGDNASLKIMREAIDKLPKRFDMRLDYAGLLLKQQRFNDALEQAEKASAIAPNHTKGKALCKCARERTWNQLIDQLVSTPPLPLEGDIGFTNTTIASAYLAKNCFEIAMNKCSRALDRDADNDSAKSLYATAHYLRDHDMAALCHEFSCKMSKLPNRIMFLFLPLALLLGAVAYYVYHSNMQQGIAYASLLGAYLLVYFIINMLGHIRRSPQKFAEIIHSEHLTPQGRRPQAVPARDVLDEIIDSKSSDAAPDTYDSLTEVAHQTERLGNRLAALSTTSFAMACLAMFFLLGAIIVHSNEAEQLGSSIMPKIQRISGIVAVVFACLAFNQRRQATLIRQRGQSQKPATAEQATAEARA
ncbi:tetratricopeptide repeat protein [bacterium]|nr:tetratricopeptide repeat protein [bacterium]